MHALVGKRHVIAQLRRELGATQPQLARRLGISLTTLQKIEAGNLAVSARTAYAMSYQTGIARRYFLANKLPANLDIYAVRVHYGKGMGTTAQGQLEYRSIHLAAQRLCLIS